MQKMLFLLFITVHFPLISFQDEHPSWVQLARNQYYQEMEAGAYEQRSLGDLTRKQKKQARQKARRKNKRKQERQGKAR